MKHQTQPDFLDQFSKQGLQSPVFWINEYTSYWSRALTPHYSYFPSPPASELQTTDTSFTSLSLWGESLHFFPQESQILTAENSRFIPKDCVSKEVPCLQPHCCCEDKSKGLVQPPRSQGRVWRSVCALNYNFGGTEQPQLQTMKAGRKYLSEEPNREL